MRRRRLKMNVLIEGKNQKTNKQLSRLILPYTHVFGRQTPESTEIIFQIPRKEYFNPEWQSVPGLGSPQSSLHFLLHPAAHPSGWMDRNGMEQICSKSLWDWQTLSQVKETGISMPSGENPNEGASLLQNSALPCPLSWPSTCSELTVSLFYYLQVSLKKREIQRWQQWPSPCQALKEHLVPA